MKYISLFLFLLICSSNYFAVKGVTISFEYEHDQIIGYSRRKQGSNPIAKAIYSRALNSTGWNILEISSSNEFSDIEQLFSAGYLEGYLTFDLINDAYYNFLNTVLNRQQISPLQQQFITNQTNWIQEQVQISQLFNSTDEYWSLAAALLAQLNGTYIGYLDAMHFHKLDNNTLTFNEFYYLTNMGDLEDIQSAIFKINRTELNCDGYVKLTNNDLICSHNTFNIYSLMLRVYKISYFNQKIYDFQFHNPAIVANFQAFSSRPGDLESKDDFYILNSGLVVLETSVPCWMRVNIANRMAHNGSDWAQVFSRYRSGTHNNQWLVVDYNKWSSKSKIDVVWMVEESFSLYKPIDFSDYLFSQGYVASYNVPYNEEIYQTTMYAQGYGFNFTNDPRAILFEQSSQNVNSIQDVMRVIRSNNNSTGNPSNAISPRSDVLNVGAYTFGGIDGKVVNQELLEIGQIYMISGPTNNGFPNFDWKNWQNVPHQGMPDLYNFPWIEYDLNCHTYHTVDMNFTEGQSLGLITLYEEQ